MSRNERKYCFRIRHVPWEGGRHILHTFYNFVCFGGISLMKTLYDAYYEEDEYH